MIMIGAGTTSEHVSSCGSQARYLLTIYGAHATSVSAKLDDLSKGANIMCTIRVAVDIIIHAKVAPGGTAVVRR